MAIRRRTILAAGLALTACTTGHAAPDENRGGAAHPNVIVVLADDLDATMFAHLPTISERVVEQGVSYPNAFAGTPMSASARATLLSGDRTPDHGTWTTYAASGGGAAGFERRGGFARTLATAVPDDYVTGWFGKVMPGYGVRGHRPSTPAGWDRWFGLLRGGYRDSTAWQNVRTVRTHGWFIDAIAHRVVRAIRQETAPLFLVAAPFNPHEVLRIQPEHAEAFRDVRYPHVPALAPTEEQLAGKPRWVRELSDPVHAAEVDERYRRRLRASLPIDELVGEILAALTASDRLEETYLVVTSDNGFRHGEFGLGFGKNDPYASSQRIPLAIRGPGVAEGAIHPGIVSLVDLPATLVALTGAAVPPGYDGISLGPTFDGETSVRAFHAIEGMRGRDDNVDSWHERRRAVRYRGFRTRSELYVETRDRSGRLEFEWYDLERDPLELDNRYDELSELRRVALAARLTSLRTTAP